MSNHRLAGNEESDEPEEPPELGRMTELIAKELNESVSAIVINANTCLRMLAADHPNVEEHARLRVGRFATATVQRKQSHG